jgi:hypothetical protein
MFRLFYKHVYDLYRQHPAFQAEYEDSSSPRRPDITFVAVDRRCGRAKMREITVTVHLTFSTSRKANKVN